MTDITIYKADGSVYASVPLTASSKHDVELMKQDKITLVWKSVEAVAVPVGSYIVHNGIKYTSTEPYNPQIKSRAEYQYQVEFHHEIFMLEKTPFFFYTTNADGTENVECDWNFTGKGSDLFITLKSAILKAIGSTYTITADDDLQSGLTLSFSNTSILSALNNIASAWDCEWWTSEMADGQATASKVLHFGKKCVHSSSYTLESGVNVDMPSNNAKSKYFSRYYVFGSERNIPQDYEGAQANNVVHKRLTLRPRVTGEASSVHSFQGGYIDTPIFDNDGNATWNTAQKKYETAVTDSDIKFTKVLILDDIYPKSNCRVKSVRYVQRYVTDTNGDKILLKSGEYDSWYLYVVELEYQDTATNEWKPFTINNSTYSKENPSGSLIKGKDLSLHFNSGALEGREFVATYITKKDYRSEDGSTSFTAENAFEIVKTEDNTIVLPNKSICPKVNTGSHNGDKVVVFNINMPEAYYNVAYQELEEKAIEQIYEDTKDSNTYTLKSNKVYFAENNPQLTIGRHISLKIGSRTIDTRVTRLVTCLDRDFEQDITLSKALTKGSINTLVSTIESTEQKVVDISVSDSTARRIDKAQFFSALREMKDSMFDTDGYFTAPISPLTIDTMMLSVGATSTNFQLEGILFQPNYSPNTETASDCNLFNVNSVSGKLAHYGIDLDGTEPKIWNMSGGTTAWYEDGVSVSTPDNSKLYYLYAKCVKNASGGTFVLDTKQRKYNEDATNYYFLIGVLSSASTSNGKTSRILNTTYGATTINGNCIHTGRISSTDGKTYFDLENGEIGGNIKFTAEQGSDNYTLINSIVSGNSDVAEAKSSAQTASGKADALDYLKTALADGSTIVSGGLVQSNIIMLGYYDTEGTLHVMTGSNGLYNPDAKGGGIASWWGGGMVDGMTTDGEFNSGGASGVIRFDGTGYLAKGNIWWSADGNLHADPLSFFVGEDSVGAMLVAFRIWSHQTADGNVVADYIEPKVPFYPIEIVNTTDKTKKVKIEVDANGNLFTTANIVTSGDVVSRATTASNIPTIKEYVDDYLEKHGGGGSGSGVASVSLTIDADYKMQVVITDTDGGTHSSQYVDLPLEDMVVDGSYDATNKNIVLDLKNGTQVTFSVADLVSGLATTTYVDTAVSGKAVDSNTMSYKGTIGSGSDLDNFAISGLYIIGGTSTANVGNFPTGAYNYGFLEVLQGFNANDIIQRYTPHHFGKVSDGNYRYRYERQKFQGGGWTPWRKIATEDIYDERYLGINSKAQSASTADSSTTSASCTGNSATATKLETPITIWGNSFDGSANITESLKSPNGMDILLCKDDHAVLGYGCCNKSKDTYVDGYNIHMRIATTHAEAVTINSSGNVGIATAFHSNNTAPTNRLDVYGVIRSRAYNAVGNNNASIIFDKNGTNYTGIGSCNEADTIHLGACNVTGAWVKNYYQKWKFNGNIISETKDGIALKLIRKVADSGVYIDLCNNNQTNNSWRIGMTSDNAFGFYYSSNGHSSNACMFNITNDGNIVSTKNATAYSDRRLKSNIKTLEYRGALTPRTYIKDGEECIGFIAQEVKEKYPELVVGNEEKEMLSLNYGGITAVLAAENIELKKKVESLEERIARLEALITGKEA